MSLELKWNKTFVITSQQIGVNLDGGNTAAPTGATLTINDCKLYIPENLQEKQYGINIDHKCLQKQLIIT